MQSNKLKYKKIYLIIPIIAILLYSITFIHPTFVQDEPFTFSLISHSFKSIISLDSMDVHPPLYYVSLKIFIDITTFWTKSIFIKVIIARIFSVLSFLLYTLCIKKIVDLCHIRINLKTAFIFLLILPVILSNIFTMRMAQFSALLLALEIVNLLEFTISTNTKYLVFAIIFTTLNLYTFYFGGLSAEIYMFLLSLVYLYKKNYKSFYKITLSEIISVFLFIPWIPFLFKQFTYHVNTDGGTTKLNIFQFIQNIITASSQFGHAGTNSPKAFVIGLFIVSIFILSFIYSIKILNNRFHLLVMLLILTSLLTLLISVFVCKNKFQMNVLYPIFMIYAPILYGIFIHLTNHLDMKNIYIRSMKLLFLLLVIVLSVLLIKSTYVNNIKQYDIPTIVLKRNVDSWKKSKNKEILVQTYNYPVSKPMTIFEDAIYLKPLNKNIKVKNESYKTLSKILTNNSNTKLTKELFPNINCSR